MKRWQTVVATLMLLVALALPGTAFGWDTNVCVPHYGGYRLVVPKSHGEWADALKKDGAYEVEKGKECQKKKHEPTKYPGATATPGLSPTSQPSSIPTSTAASTATLSPSVLPSVTTTPLPSATTAPDTTSPTAMATPLAPVPTTLPGSGTASPSSSGTPGSQRQNPNPENYSRHYVCQMWGYQPRWVELAHAEVQKDRAEGRLLTEPNEATSCPSPTVTPRKTASTPVPSTSTAIIPIGNTDAPQAIPTSLPESPAVISEPEGESSEMPQDGPASPETGDEPSPVVEAPVAPVLPEPAPSFPVVPEMPEDCMGPNILHPACAPSKQTRGQGRG